MENCIDSVIDRIIINHIFRNFNMFIFPFCVDTEMKSEPEKQKKRRKSVAPTKSALTRYQEQNPEPAVEDIYLNMLWRDQMPKEKMWEPILEEPKQDKKTGTSQFFAGRKQRCLVKFEDFPSQAKVRQRRQRAAQMGWKPLTKKKIADLDRRLNKKLEELDQEIEKDYGSIPRDSVVVSDVQDV